MSQRVTTWLAWLTRTLCVLLVTSAGLLVLLSFSALTLRESVLLSLMLLLLITFPTVGAVVALRHPEIYEIDRSTVHHLHHEYTTERATRRNSGQHRAKQSA